MQSAGSNRKGVLLVRNTETTIQRDNKVVPKLNSAAISSPSLHSEPSAPTNTLQNR